MLIVLPMVATVPKDELTSNKKSRKNGEKKLKRLHQEAEQPEKPFKGSVSKPASSAPEGGMAGMPLVSAHESTTPPSAVTSVANTDGSRYIICGSSYYAAETYLSTRSYES